MDAGFSSPLLDLFRRGEAVRDIRLLAARGTLAPRAHEQLALLMFLVDDHDAEVAETAHATLGAIPRESLARFLARPDASEEARAFFAARGIQPAESAGGDGEDLFSADEKEGGEEEAADEGSLLQRIAAMTVAQRVIRAMKGSREERAILIRDPNKLVSAAVLSRIAANPMLPKEVQSQVDLDNITFVSNDRLQSAMAGTTATPAQVAEAVRVNTEARLRALKIGLLIMAGLALLAFIPAGRLPNYRPGEIPSDQPAGKAQSGKT